MVENKMLKVPKAFVSYCWEDVAHRIWVRDLAIRLRRDMIEVTLDQWHAVPGDQLPEFMETAARETDFVLLICTPKYKSKADQRHGGVGYEGDVMTAEVFTKKDQRKFIPILRRGEWADAAPSWVLGKYYIDLRHDPYSDDAYYDLVLTLQGKRPQPPPVGGLATPSERTAGAEIELTALMDLMVTEIKSMQYIGHTFGETRRILVFVHRLHKLLRSRLFQVEGVLNPDVLETVRRFHRLVDNFISEANYVSPTASDDKYTEDTERLKEYRYQVERGWEVLKEQLLPKATMRAGFERLRNEGDALWRITGYHDQSEYEAYVSPRTKDILKSADPTELALLTTLVEKVETTSRSLIAEGFPKATVVETLNALMRDEYVKTEDWKVFRMTTIGAKIVKELLTKRTADGSIDQGTG